MYLNEQLRNDFWTRIDNFDGRRDARRGWVVDGHYLTRLLHSRFPRLRRAGALSLDAEPEGDASLADRSAVARGSERLLQRGRIGVTPGPSLIFFDVSYVALR